MINYIESFCKSLGNYGCYVFCLIDIAEKSTGKTFDVLSVIKQGIDRGLISFDYDDYSSSNNFTVNDPTSFLNMLTGRKWSKTWQNSSYVFKDEDWPVAAWHKDGNNYVDGTPIYHFARPGYNSLQRSVSVEQGRIDSYRIFREVS